MVAREREGRRRWNRLRERVPRPAVVAEEIPRHLYHVIGRMRSGCNTLEGPDRPPSRRTALSADQLEQAHLALLTHSRDPELDDLVFGFLRETGCRRHGGTRRPGRRDRKSTRLNSSHDNISYAGF